MKKEKKKNVIVIFTLMILLGNLFLSIYPIKISALNTENRDYTFETDYLYNNSNIEPSEFDYWNIRNQTSVSQEYNATYSFENEIGKSETNIDWIDQTSGTESYHNAIIELNNDGHNSIMKVNTSGDNGKYWYWKHTPIQFNIGIVELWAKYIDLGVGKLEFYFEQSGNTPINTIFNSENNRLYSYYGDGIGGIILSYIDWSSNVWCHLKWLWNCSSDTYSLYVNGKVFIDNKNFRNDMDIPYISAYKVQLSTGGGLNALEGYIDAIGESWNCTHNALYSFEEELGNTDLEISYNNDVIADTESSIIETYQYEHQNIMKVKALSTYAYCKNVFAGITEGNIEFWILKPTIATKWNFRVDSNTGEAFFILFDSDGDIEFYNSTYTNIGTYQVNTWYHVRVNFSCITDTTDVYINRNLVLSNGKFRFVGSYIYRDFLLGQTLNSFCYFDAIDYSWSEGYYINRNYYPEGYLVGDNLIPIYEQTNNLECDKWEFALQKFNTLNPNGLDNPNGWTDLETGGYDKVNINDDSTNDKRVEILYGGLTSYNPLGLTRSFTTLDSYVYNISWYFRFQVDTSSMDALNNLDVYSNDSTLITRVRFFNENIGALLYHALQYYDGSNYHNLTLGIVGYQWYAMNLYINYYDNLAHLSLFNGSFYYYTFPLITTGKMGIGQVQYYMDDHSGHYTMNIYLDWLGIYEDGLSVSDELGYMTLLINEDWSYENSFLFYHNSDCGHINYTTVSGSYSVGETDYSIINFTQTEYSNNYISIYHQYITNILNANLLFSVCNYYDDIYLGLIPTRNFKIDKIRIESILLKDVLDDVSKLLQFQIKTNWNYYSNYFYESNGRLYYTLTCTDSSLEYISAQFNINNIYSRNFSIRLIQNYEYTYYTSTNFTVLYNDLDQDEFIHNATEYYDISYILPQNKYIDKFAFNISDNDNSLSSGSISHGYFNSIVLFYVANIEITILTTNLLNAIIPLLIILPTAIVLKERFKSGQVFVATMLIMSIICFVAGFYSLQMLVLLIAGYIFLFINARESEGG